MKVRVLVAAGVFAGLGIGAQAWAGDAAKRLVGAWRLVSIEQRMSDGTRRPSPRFGPNTIGYLIYSESGRMCTVLTDPDRVQWNSSDTPTEAELRARLEHFAAYCGRYKVNEAEGFVIHHVEIDVVPNSVGADLKRLFSLDGNRLRLRPAEQVAENVVEYTLTWERIDSPNDHSTKGR